MFWGVTDDMAYDASAELADLLIDVVEVDREKPIPSTLRMRIIKKLNAWAKRHGMRIRDWIVVQCD